MTMHISEHDVVRVIAEIPEDRVVVYAGHGRMPRTGDAGTVVMVYPVGQDREPAYAVEFADDDGVTLWLADILASELALVASAPFDR